MFKKYQTLIFFGALCANIRDFEIHDGNFTTGSLNFGVESEIATGSLNFGPKKALSFYIC